MSSSALFAVLRQFLEVDVRCRIPLSSKLIMAQLEHINQYGEK